jgi:hypothetical protein
MDQPGLRVAHGAFALLTALAQPMVGELEVPTAVVGLRDQHRSRQRVALDHRRVRHAVNALGSASHDAAIQVRRLTESFTKVG